MAASEKAVERWAALESNPEVLSSFCHLGGVSPQWEVVDVWGLDPDLLGFVPQPVLALILLFPTKDEQGEKVRERQHVEEHPVSASTYFLRQVEGLSNACGTIAMLHAIFNNRDLLGIEGKECTLGKFYTETKNLNAEERGRALDDSADIGSVHNGLVAEGQSHQVEGDKVRHHFVCLTAVDGHLVELDGAYNSGPLVVKSLGDEMLLTAAASHVKEKYLASTDSIQFSLMALVMKQD